MLPDFHFISNTVPVNYCKEGAFFTNRAKFSNRQGASAIDRTVPRQPTALGEISARRAGTLLNF